MYFVDYLLSISGLR